jgi:MFS transporter, DHA1 family, multidrug resistance protein
MLTAKSGWTWTIWELMWLSGFVLVLMLFFLPETSHANILHRRAKRLRKLTGNESLKSKSEIRAAEESYKETLIVLRRAFSLSFREPIVFVLNLYVALLYGLLYIWFESFPIVFQGIYNFTPNEEALAFLGIFVGGLITVPAFLWYLHRYIVPRFNDRGVIKPEERLPPLFVGAFCLPICLFWFGWSSRESVHWIVPIVGSGIFTVGVITIFNSVLNYLGGAYPDYAASVFASNGLMRASFGAAFPLFVSLLWFHWGWLTAS